MDKSVAFGLKQTAAQWGVHGPAKLKHMRQLAFVASGGCHGQRVLNAYRTVALNFGASLVFALTAPSQSLTSRIRHWQ